MTTRQQLLPCVLILSLLFLGTINSQDNTVGLIDYKPWADSYFGYNLLYPHNQPNVYLLDNCGRIVHRWEDEPQYIPGNTAYLTEDGIMIKAKKVGSINIPIWTTEGETYIEARDWDNNLLWQLDFLNEKGRLHHDFTITPKGTILAIAWDHYSIEEAIGKGRDSLLMEQETFSPEKIIEYDPSVDSIIWEWRAWDHCIQEVDSTLTNYAAIAEYPGKIDINWENNSERADWMHSNAIDYTEELDLILLNVPTFNEMWIIDHSTTREEAAGDSGGLFGKGGQLLWRWGNPMTYKMGDASDQKLFFQHDAAWALDFLSKEENDHYGKITLFNNQIDDEHSTISILAPELDTANFEYRKDEEGRFLPSSFDYVWQHPEPLKVSSTGLSSVQILPNDNLLICSGRNGYSLELNPNENIVWEYITPIIRGERVTQGVELDRNDNLTFRIRRYPESYPAFWGKELEISEYLELEPDEAFCDRLTATTESVESAYLISPNPVESKLSIQSESPVKSIVVSSVIGQSLTSEYYDNDHFTYVDIDVSDLAAGVYILSVNGVSRQFVKN